jgi:hypothetical protein
VSGTKTRVQAEEGVELLDQIVAELDEFLV